MKKLLVKLCLSAICGLAPQLLFGQWINLLTVFPTNPTTADTITVIANCSFSAGGCDESTQTMFVMGNNVYASSLHCIGILSVICYDNDTFLINPLPAGNYTFHFQLDAGGLPSPCTPGIVPGPNDSILFIVSPAVGAGEMITQDEIKLYPNPSFDQFGVSGFVESDFPVTVTVFTIDGKRAFETTLTDNEKQVDISSIPDGPYQVSALCRDGRQIILPMLKSSGR